MNLFLFDITQEQAQSILGLIVIGSVFYLAYIFKKYMWQRRVKARRDYYRNVYLKSDAWQRKRYVVLRRDSWTCVYCGARATQVHHTRYAKYNIGKEPIHWLVSVCKPCHDSLHQFRLINEFLSHLAKTDTRRPHLKPKSIISFHW